MKVSVIIPTYCRAPLLCEAIDSVLAQDFADIEVIVIDDGSTDDTELRAHEYKNRIRYVRQENRGLSAARNLGLSLADGEYVAFLDDDDWWMPGKLRLQSAVLDQLPELAGVYTNFTIYRGDKDLTTNGIQTWYETQIDWTEVIGRSMPVRELLGIIDVVHAETMLYIGTLYERSLEQYFVLPSTAMIRRSHVTADLQFPLHDPICGDWEFFARISKDAPLCFIDCDTTFNRSHVDKVRLTRTSMIRQIELRIDFLERVYKNDESFYAGNKRRVDDVWKKRLAQLCTLQLLDLNPSAARETSTKLRGLGSPLNVSQRAILAACRVPGSGWLMRCLRALRRRL